MENTKQQLEKLREEYQIPRLEKKVSVMIQFLFQEDQAKHLVKYHLKKNIKLIIDIKLLKKSKNFYKFTVFNFVKI